MHNPLRRGTIALLTSVVVAAVPSDALAQHDPYGDPHGGQPQDPYGEPRAIATLDVKFAGGTLEEFIAAVRDAASIPVNIVVTDETALAHPIPPLNLRGVSLFNALKTLEWARDRKGDRLSVFIQAEGWGEPIYGISRPKQSALSAPRPVAYPSAAVRVFMIRDLIEPPQGQPADGTTIMQPESLLAAVDAVLASIPDDAEEPTVRFHPESATLIVTAPEQQLQAINQLLLSVQEDIQSRRHKVIESTQRLTDAEVRLRRSEVEIQALQDQIMQTERVLQNVQDRLKVFKQRENVDISTAEVKAMENEVAAVQAQLAQLRGQLQMKQIEQEVARSDLEAARQGAAQPPAAAEAIAANYFEPVVIRARPEFIAVLRAVREAMPAGGLPTINGNTDQGLTVTATEVQHAILRAAVEAMSAAAGDQPQRERNNRRE